MKAALELGALDAAVKEYAVRAPARSSTPALPPSQAPTASFLDDRTTHAPPCPSAQAALPLLERYGTGAFATVKAETASSVKDIGDKLRNTLRSASTSPDDAAEALELLQMLKMPQDELQREWLAERRTALVAAMHSAGEAFWAAHRESGAAAVDVHDFVRHVDRGFLTELIKTANQYKDVRSPAACEPFLFPLMPCCAFPAALCSSLSLILEEVQTGEALTSECIGSAFAAPAPAQLFPETRQALVSLARQSLGEFLAFLQEVLSPKEGPLPPAKGLMAALAQVAADLASVARVLPEARLDDRAAEMVEKTVRKHVIGLFQRLEEAAAGSLSDALKQLPQPGKPGEAVSYRPLLQTQAQVCNDLTDGLVRVLREVAALQDERPVLLASWRDVFADLVQGQAQMWFTGLTATAISAAGLPPMPEAARMLEALQATEHQRSTADPVPAPAAFLLFLLRVVGFLEGRAVETVVEKFGQCFGAQFGEGADAHATFSREAVLRLLRTAQSRLLVGYVQQQGRKLSKLVRTSMAVRCGPR